MWYGELPRHWEPRTVKSLFSIKKDIAGNEGYDVLSITQRGIRVKDIASNEGQMARSYDKYQFVNVGDFAMNHMDLLTGWVDCSKYFGVTSPDYRVFSLNDTSQNKEYLLRVMQLCYTLRIFYAFGRGAASEGRWRLPRKEFMNFMLPLPPRDEQDQIVRYLDWKVSQINKLINAKRRQVVLLQEQKEVVIREVILKHSEGLRQFRIKMIAEILRGKFSHRPRNDPDYYDGAYPFIQTSEVARAGKYINEYKQTLNEKGFAVSKLFPKGTLTMTIAANIGDVAILNFDACFPDSIIGFIPNDGVDLDYLYYVLYNMKAEFLRETPVNTQGNLNVERVGAMNISIPNNEQQREIVTKIERITERIDTITLIIQDEINLFTEYRTRLISDVVTGKLDVRSVLVPVYNQVQKITVDNEIKFREGEE